MKAFTYLLAVLAITVSVRADNSIITEGEVPSVGDSSGQFVGIPRNNCGDVFEYGALSTYGLTTVHTGNTTGAGNDFDGYVGYPCDMESTGGQDEIWQFQVAKRGYWYFGTCFPGFGLDSTFGTSIAVTQDDGSCPGVPVACNGGNVECANGAFIEEVLLQRDVTYYLIVDGSSPAAYGSYIWAYNFLRDFCEEDAHCDDGVACNGVETCDVASHECLPGIPVECLRWQQCTEPTGECADPDPCYTWQTGEGAGFIPPLVWDEHPEIRIGDDVELETHGSTRELISYKMVYGAFSHWWGAEPEGTPYSVTTGLYLTAFSSCVPWVVLPGTECTFDDLAVQPRGTDPVNLVCEPDGGLPTGLQLPDNSNVAGLCEIDFWMVSSADIWAAGVQIAGMPKHIGEFGIEDDMGQDMYAREQVDPDTGLPNNVWVLDSVPSHLVSDFGDAYVCTVPAGGCCFEDGGCEVLSEDECTDTGGTWQGPNTMADPVGCEDPDSDGFMGTCDNCPDDANPGQRDCNGDGEGDACEQGDERDDDGDGSCNGVDDCPSDPMKIAPGQCGCGTPDTDSDFDFVANCLDDCPMNPVWQIEPVCGCDSVGYDNEDDDDDGFANCFDTCSGADDAAFGPCEPASIPTTSVWGLIVLGLVLLVMGKTYFGYRRRDIA
ncbi:MAG: hypothetical protein JSU63_16155 [Phycisphaerales bacterium]|nr:MAG: hypothetical protein JSU63_16155 [Phycisphaerales bacterium]